MRRLVLLSAVAFVGCPQTINVVSAPDGSFQASRDGGSTSTPQDGGSGPSDGGRGSDAGETDAGVPFTVTPSDDDLRVNVRESVQVDFTVSPPGTATTFSFCRDVATERAPNRPALVPAEYEHTLTIDAATGRVDFEVTVVPPWFFATTFSIAVCADGPDGTVETTVRVLVRGNVLVSSGYQGIFAFASDGLPARGVGRLYPEGNFIDDTVGAARGMRLMSDGTLVVFDAATGGSGMRLLRYEVTAAENRTQVFDTGMAEAIYYDSRSVYSIAELPNGQIAITDSHQSGISRPRALLWDSDGTFDREIVGMDVNDAWLAVGGINDGQLLVAREANINNRLINVDMQTGAELGNFTDNVGRNLFAIEVMDDGALYVVGDWRAYRVTAAGATMPIANLPNLGSRDWVAAARYDDGRVLIATNRQSETEAIAIVRGTNFEGWVRRAGNAAGLLQPSGIVYLE